MTIKLAICPQVNSNFPDLEFLQLPSKNRILAVFALFFLFTFQATGQLFHENLINSEKRLGFKEIVKLTEQYYDRNSREKGNGYKQFQRWKYWAERNLDQNGRVRDNNKALRSYDNFRAQSNRRAQRKLSEDYTELGPLSQVNTSTWSSGLGRVSAIGLDPTNDDHIIVGSPSGGIWKTEDLGANWIPIFDDQALIEVYSLEISRTNPDHYWAGLNGKVVRSIDGGVTWTDVSGVTTGLYNTIEMHPTIDNIVFAVNQGAGIVFRSTDGGQNFVQVLDHRRSLFDLEFHPTDPFTVYTSGIGAVYTSTDGGINFNEIVVGPWDVTRNTKMVAVTPAAPNNIYVLEEINRGFNAVYFSDDQGLTWETLTDNACNCRNMLGYELDEAGGQAPRDMDIIVSPVNQNIIHIAGVETWRSTNLGANWAKTTHWDRPGRADFIHADIDLLIYDGNRIVAGTDGGIYFSVNEATTWTNISAGLGIRQFYKIGASETVVDRVTGGSQDNGTGILVEDVWRDWLGADGMETFIDWSNENIVYGTSQFGILYRSLNGGLTRDTRITTPDRRGFSNWVTPFEQDPIDPNTIYTARTDVFRSLNGGRTWTSILGSTVGADQMKIAPTDNNFIYVAYNQDLFITTDGGVNWTSTALPAFQVNSIAVNPFDPERLSVVLTGGAIRVMESTDAGATFTDITGDIPRDVGIECVVYETSPDGGMFVGGNPGIYYTESTDSPVWEDTTNNLPKVKVTELEIRNDIMYVSTYGRGLWKINLEFEDAQNEISILNPPTTVTANELVDIDITYKNEESVNAHLSIRFVNPSGEHLERALTQVAPGEGTVTMRVSVPGTPGSAYKLYAQLQLTGTWEGLAEATVNNITVESSGGGDNSVTMLNPPTTVSAGDVVNMTLNYNNTESTNAYVLARFISPSGEHLQDNQHYVEVTPGEGTVTLQVPAPSTAGSGYKYFAQLLLTGTWAGLAQDNVENVTVESSGGGDNSVTMLNPPTTVSAGDVVNMTLNYNNTESTNAYVLARFISPSGEHLQDNQHYVEVTPGEGTVTLQVPAPSTAGSGYKYFAQLLLTGTWQGLAEDNIEDVTIESSSGGGNSVTMMSPPTTVSSGDVINMTVNYNNTESQNAYVLARFISPSGDHLNQNQHYVEVMPGEGTVNLQIPVPSTTGSGYKYFAQLLLTGTWEGLAEDNIEDVTINTTSSSTTVTLVDPPLNAPANDFVDVTVNYNNRQSVDAYLLVRFVSPSGEHLEQALTEVSPGVGTETLQVPTPAIPGTGYKYFAQLLLTGTWEGLAENVVEGVTVDINGEISVNSVSLMNPPTVVTSNQLVDVNLDYVNTESVDAYVLVRFKSPSGDNLGDAFTRVDPGQGSVSLQVAAPSIAGIGYSYQAQLLLADTWAGLAEDVLIDVRVDDSGDGTNFVELVNPPTNVTADQMVDVEVKYNNAEDIDAYVLVRFLNPSGVHLDQQAYTQINPGTGTVNLQVPVPSTVGSGYSFFAQLLLTGTWTGLAADTVPDVTIDESDSECENYVVADQTITSGSDMELKAGVSIELIVNFEVQQGALFHAFIESCGN